MALYIRHSILHLARLLYVRPETFGPYYVNEINRWTCPLSKGSYDMSVVSAFQKLRLNWKGKSVSLQPTNNEE